MKRVLSIRPPNDHFTKSCKSDVEGELHAPSLHENAIYGVECHFFLIAEKHPTLVPDVLQATNPIYRLNY